MILGMHVIFGVSSMEFRSVDSEVCFRLIKPNVRKRNKLRTREPNLLILTSYEPQILQYISLSLCQKQNSTNMYIQVRSVKPKDTDSTFDSYQIILHSNLRDDAFQASECIFCYLNF